MQALRTLAESDQLRVWEEEERENCDSRDGRDRSTRGSSDDGVEG